MRKSIFGLEVATGMSGYEQSSEDKLTAGSDVLMSTASMHSVCSSNAMGYFF